MRKHQLLVLAFGLCLGLTTAGCSTDGPRDDDDTADDDDDDSDSKPSMALEGKSVGCSQGKELHAPFYLTASAVLGAPGGPGSVSDVVLAVAPVPSFPELAFEHLPLTLGGPAELMSKELGYYAEFWGLNELFPQTSSAACSDLRDVEWSLTAQTVDGHVDSVEGVFR